MSAGEITILLHRLASGDCSAEAELIPQVYIQLKKLAVRHLSHEHRGHTLQPTDLVHEAYLKLVGQKGSIWNDRVHFFAVASRLMRQVLVDYARRKGADKRGGAELRVELDEGLLADAEECQMVNDLDRALGELERLDARQARIVEMRFFGGLTEEEIGVVLGISSRTVKRDWVTARAWLHDALSS